MCRLKLVPRLRPGHGREFCTSQVFRGQDVINSSAPLFGAKHPVSNNTVVTSSDSYQIATAACNTKSYSRRLVSAGSPDKRPSSG